MSVLSNHIVVRSSLNAKQRSCCHCAYISDDSVESIKKDCAASTQEVTSCKTPKSSDNDSLNMEEKQNNN